VNSSRFIYGRKEGRLEGRKEDGRKEGEAGLEERRRGQGLGKRGSKGK